MKVTDTSPDTVRGFRVHLECESCGHQSKNRNAFDTPDFFARDVPLIECEECGESTESLGEAA